MVIAVQRRIGIDSRLVEFSEPDKQLRFAHRMGRYLRVDGASKKIRHISCNPLIYLGIHA
ncbi:hypothetical protein CBM2623_U50020 [Cupriavidus taiwanensis]|nr:hypothetical protein CBM2608_U50013 [Cupriavidus taiwanensis]SPA38455.1 hypothetical protein CBM2623_U50020 [Cupriavidus taiwanensis]